MQSPISRNHLRYAEYGLLVILISLIVLFFLSRVREVHKNAERMAVMGEINALRAGVVTMLHPPQGVPESGLPGMNPVLLLESPPKHYIGQLRDTENRHINAGSWYFHSRREILVYKARFAHDFPFIGQASQRIRLRLVHPGKTSQTPQHRILACGQDICLTALQHESYD